MKFRDYMSYFVFFLSFFVFYDFSFAAAPLGGYTAGSTHDPDCAPGDPDCFVQALVDTDAQVLSLSGSILSISNGNTVFLPVQPTLELNSLTGAVQSFAVGSIGNDFTITSTGSTHTFNIPDASVTARGLVSTLSQAFAGIKTFLGDVFFDGNITLGDTFSDIITVNGALKILDGNQGTGKVLISDASGNATWQTLVTTDNQILSLSGSTLFISGGNSLDMDPLLSNSDDQTLSLSGNTLSIANGNSVLLNYLTGFTETDPIFTSSPSFGIGTGSISNWNTAFGWGDHAIEGYLTGTTTNVPEGTNLYYTNARGIGSILTGFVSGSGTVTATDSILQAIQKLQGSNTVQDTNISAKIGLTSLSATGPLSYNSGSGVFSISQANSGTNGYLSSADWNIFNNKQNAMSQATTSSSGWLSSTDWNTFNSKENSLTFNNGLTRSGSVVGITPGTNGQILSMSGTSIIWRTPASSIVSINGLSSTSQTFVTATGGIDFAISSSGSVHTLSIPDASQTARGLVSIGTQTIAGTKTFSSNPIFSNMTPGSVLFIGTGGLLSQNNSNFFWDNNNGRLGIGNSTPSSSIHISGTGSSTNGLVRLDDASDSDKVVLDPNFGIFHNRSLSYINNSNIGGSFNIRLSNTGSLDTVVLSAQSNGNIGIGTTSPSSKFEINSGISGVSGFRFTQLLSSSPSNTQFSGILGVNSTGDVGITELTGNSFTGFTAGQLTFGTASGRLTQSSNLFWNNASGSLGIGTSSPVDALSVVGNMTLTGQIRLSALANSSANTPNFIIPSNNRLSFGETYYPPNDTGSVVSFASQSSTRNMTFAFGKTGVHTSFFSDNGNSTMIGTEGTVPIIFRNSISYSSTDISTSGNEIMRLAGNRNVGIGTTTPSAKLDVNGNIKIADSNATCAAGNAGEIRYNTGTSKHQGCNGIIWNDLY